MSTGLIIRPAMPEDAPTCARICYEAFAHIASAHNFPPDVPSPEAALRLTTMLFSGSDLYCVVAEKDGKIIGSNCLVESDAIFGIGPITVDLAAQNQGAGRALMSAVMERAAAKNAAGTRLVQAAFHSRSLSLYASLGFNVREPLACMQGKPKQQTIPGFTVRTAQRSDLEACNALAKRIHGFHRGNELAQSIERGAARVVERNGDITGYATGLSFFHHATAETNPDLEALIASAESFSGPGILIPTRNASLFRWCLANGLRVVQPMTLMSTGLYTDPAGAWLPSVLY